MVTIREPFMKIFPKTECITKIDRTLGDVRRQGAVDPRNDHAIGMIPEFDIRIRSEGRD